MYASDSATIDSVSTLQSGIITRCWQGIFLALLLLVPMRVEGAETVIVQNDPGGSVVAQARLVRVPKRRHKC